MKTRLTALVLFVVLSLSGCSNMFSGSYYSAEPHLQDAVPMSGQSYAAGDLQDLRDIFKKMVDTYQTQAVILADGYGQDRLEEDLREAYLDIIEQDPLASYAVEGIVTKVGKAEGKTAVTLTIEYIYDESYLKSIKKVGSMDDAIRQIHTALVRCDVGLTILVDKYEERDMTQVVEDYALLHPHQVMEVPQVSTNVYPYTGDARVVEMYFTYRTSRDSLKRMKEKVGQVFDSAELYVSDDIQPQQKYLQLWAFLMERFEYRYDTSITPAYSLLHHGVGDSRAFAQVYAAMCGQKGLECRFVSGTRSGKSHCWVIIRVDETYYHLDLLEEEFRMRADGEMEGYVWDYSAHPVCGAGDAQLYPETPAA